MSTPFARHWFLSGPTASGKSAVALELARTLGAEIVSMDSMAVFRQLDIGTAKPTLAERAAVPHHLLDVAEPHDDFSLAEYLDLAERVCAEISARGRQVLFVGGTPLYLKALLRGVFEGPPPDWALRQRWHEYAEREGNTALHAQLALVDPASARRLHPQDTRRIIRALEVHELTGQSITALQQQFHQGQQSHECRVFVLNWPREELVERINRRVDAMFAAGWLEEARALKALSRPLSRTAMQALGYRELFEHFDGQRSLEETIERIKILTRQFSKRQLTWFRSLSECRWITMQEPVNARELAEQIASSASSADG